MTDSFTKVPNDLLDVLIEDPNVLTRKGRILLYIIRQTYGYHRETTQKQADLVSKIVTKTGIAKAHVYATLKELIDQGVLTRGKDKRIRICDGLKKRRVSEDTKEYIDLDAENNEDTELIYDEYSDILGPAVIHKKKVGTPPPRSKADEEEIASWIGDEWDEMERIQAQIKAEADWIWRGVKRNDNGQSDK